MILFNRIVLVLLFNIIAADNYQKNIVNQEYQFGINFMNTEDYERAITSFKKVNLLTSDSLLINTNLELISKCYFLNNKYFESIETSRILLKNQNDSWYATKNIVNCYKELNYFIESNMFIDEQINYFQNSYKDTLILFSSINNVYLYKLNEAIENLAMIDQKSSLFELSESFIKKIKNNNQHLRLKNKKVAALVSIIPGGGYFYTGHYQTGFASMLANYLFFNMARDSFSIGHNGLGSFTSFLTISFYLGSLTGSLQLVDKHNYTVKKKGRVG